MRKLNVRNPIAPAAQDHGQPTCSCCKISRAACFSTHFADHLAAVDPHAERGERRIGRHRKAIDGLNGAVLRIGKDLRHLGDCRSVIHFVTLDMMLLDFQQSAVIGP